MKKKIIVFDVDGTLLNTIPTIAYHTNRALKEFGYRELEINDYRYILGYGAHFLIENAIKIASGEKKTEEEIQRVLKVYDKYYREDPIYLTKPYDGIEDVLNEIKERDYLLACFSNKQHHVLVDVIEKVFGKDTFDYVLGQKDGIKPKPDPSGLNSILSYANLDKKDAVFIGDTEVDVNTGVNGGVYTIAVAWGFRTYNDLKDLNYDVLIKNTKEILENI